MSYVLFNRESSRLIGKCYRTYPAAKAAVTRMHKKWAQDPANLQNLDNDPRFTVGIAEINHYQENIERMVTRRNLISGEEYQESVNTPLHMSPASETYWSF